MMMHDAHWTVVLRCSDLLLCLPNPLLVDMDQPLPLRVEVLVNDRAKDCWWTCNVFCHCVLDCPVPDDVAVPAARRR
jgi:hypothetical protein